MVELPEFDRAIFGAGTKGEGEPSPCVKQDSPELKFRENNPYLVESLYHS
jgi:hypothetical protein